MNLQFATSSQAVDERWQLVSKLGVHSPDLKPNSYNTKNMKLDLNPFTNVKFNVTDLGF